MSICLKLVDVVAWVGPVLSSTANANLAELATQAAVAILQMHVGCLLSPCVNVDLLLQRTQAFFSLLVSAGCSSSSAHPSDFVLQQLLTLDSVGQSLGVDTTALRSCEKAVLRALIMRDVSTALQSPTDVNLNRLDGRISLAQRLSFDDLETL